MKGKTKYYGFFHMYVYVCVGGGVCVWVYNFMKIEGETMGVYMNMRKIQLYKKYSYIFVCVYKYV